MQVQRLHIQYGPSHVLRSWIMRERCVKACLMVRCNVMKRNKPAAASIHASTPLSKVKDSSVLAAEVVHLRRGQRELRAELERVNKSVEEGCVGVPSELHTDLLQVGRRQDGSIRAVFLGGTGEGLQAGEQGDAMAPDSHQVCNLYSPTKPRLLYAGHGNPETPRRVNVAWLHLSFLCCACLQGQVFEDLQLQVENYDAEHRYVCLLHDEMSIKSDLVFDRKSNEVIGYVSPQ